MICTFRLNQKGFASISLLLIFPLLMLIVFSFTLMSYIIQYKIKMRSTCYLQTIDIQKNLIRGEEQLFKLNPLAKSLRIQLATSEIAFAAAVAAENWYLAQQAQEKIAHVKEEQAHLDRSQRLIIQTTALNLNLQTLQLQTELSNLSAQMNSVWSFYLQGLTRVQISKKAEVAVVPDEPDLAPVYELATEYSQRQRLVYVWQHRFHTKASAQTFLESESDFGMSCGTSGRKERGLWSILINEVRS